MKSLDLNQLFGTSLEELLHMFYLENAPESIRIETMSLIGGNMLRRVTLTVFEELTPDEGAHALDLLEKRNFPVLIVYLRDRIPDIELLIRDTAQEEIHATLRETRPVSRFLNTTNPSR